MVEISKEFEFLDIHYQTNPVNDPINAVALTEHSLAFNCPRNSAIATLRVFSLPTNTSLNPPLPILDNFVILSGGISRSCRPRLIKSKSTSGSVSRGFDTGGVCGGCTRVSPLPLLPRPRLDRVCGLTVPVDEGHDDSGIGRSRHLSSARASWTFFPEVFKSRASQSLTRSSRRSRTSDLDVAALRSTKTNGDQDQSELSPSGQRIDAHIRLWTLRLRPPPYLNPLPRLQYRTLIPIERSQSRR
jgi:hypothetical protein